MKDYKIIHKYGYSFKKTISVLKGYFRRIILIFNLRKYSLIYIFLNVTPLGGSFMEKLYRFFSKKIIYDIDDLVYLNKYSDRSKIARYLRSPEKYYYLMKTSDHVITCTSYLDKFVRKFNKKTTNISSTVNTLKYTHKKKNFSKKIVLGWTGSFSTLPYLNLIENVIHEIQNRYDCKIHIICSDKKKFNFKNYKSFKWNSSDEVKVLKTIDIGLYPLPDEEWVKGKSGLKAIQYMALGIPVVATKTEINKKVILNGKTGFLVNSKEDWINKISILIKNQQLRHKMGYNSAKHVYKNFSIKANQDKYLNIIKNLT